MRRSPITVGVLAAELAIGALVLAPPAGAADDPVPTDPPVDVPLPVPEVPVPSVSVPTVVVRTGRAGDPNAVTPVADDDTGAPPADSTPPAPPAPEPEPSPEPSSPPKAPAPTPGADVPASPSVPDPATPTPTPAPAAGSPPLHTVVDGDNLWSIAAAHLAAATGRDVGSIPVAEVALYWVRVCDANAPTLASGDLDVIYPGELIALPPF